MADTWQGGDRPAPAPLGPGGWIRVILRGVPLGLLVFGGLAVMLLLRMIERPVFGLRRPVTPYITQCVCRGFFLILGMRHRSIGQPMQGAGAVVANHVSWIDIFALNLRKRIYFVSKAEVARWPGIGWLARATGTVFINRQRQEARAQITLFRDRLGAGHKLVFFPEGTSTDGLRVLSFKPTLFAAFFDPDLIDTLQIQPVTLRYDPPSGADPRFYGWWGDMAFGPHLLATLAAPRHGQVAVIYHDPLRIADFSDRKVLARQLEDTVRAGLAQHDPVQPGKR